MNIFLTAAKEIVLKKEEKRLIEIIRDVLAGKNKSEWSMQISKEEIERVIKCARVHGVLPFLQECPVFMEEPYREKLFFYLKDYAYKDAQQAYAAETLFELFEKKRDLLYAIERNTDKAVLSVPGISYDGRSGYFI